MHSKGGILDQLSAKTIAQTWHNSQLWVSPHVLLLAGGGLPVKCSLWHFSLQRRKSPVCHSQSWWPQRILQWGIVSFYSLYQRQHLCSCSARFTNVLFFYLFFYFFTEILAFVSLDCDACALNNFTGLAKSPSCPHLNCKWFFCITDCKSLCQAPQSWTHRAWIWVLWTYVYARFCVAAALPMR